MSEPNVKPVSINNFVDAYNAHDIKTRQSVNGLLMILNTKKSSGTESSRIECKNKPTEQNW